MALSKSANTYNRQNWEESEFPILCQTCLGDNPYLRMTREKYGKECKTCARPFTVFRWCPGARMRFKKTEVCQTCSKTKNVCQTCLLDLEYGLPVQVRDVALSLESEMPKSDVGREFYTQNMERELANTDGTVPGGALGKVKGHSDMLLKLARTAPYYKRNRPHICSFWVKGECKRGEECPYRHEKPTDPDDPLADQNIKDRFFGINDPVADKLMRRYTDLPKLDLPDDKAITTLYVANLGDYIAENHLRDYFYQFGEIRTITMVSKQQCAFVQFASRMSAEQAVEKSFNKLIIFGRRLTVKWGKPQSVINQSYTEDGGQEGMPNLQPVPGLPGALPAPPDFFNLNNPTNKSYIDLPPVAANFKGVHGSLVAVDRSTSGRVSESSIQNHEDGTKKETDRKEKTGDKDEGTTEKKKDKKRDKMDDRDMTMSGDNVKNKSNKDSEMQNDNPEDGNNNNNNNNNNYNSRKQLEGVNNSQQNNNDDSKSSEKHINGEINNNNINNNNYKVKEGEIPQFLPRPPFPPGFRPPPPSNPYPTNIGNNMRGGPMNVGPRRTIPLNMGGAPGGLPPFGPPGMVRRLPPPGGMGMMMRPPRGIRPPYNPAFRNDGQHHPPSFMSPHLRLPPPPGMMHPPQDPKHHHQSRFPPQPPPAIHYPSQDPTRMGSRDNGEEVKIIGEDSSQSKNEEKD